MSQLLVIFDYIIIKIWRRESKYIRRESSHRPDRLVEASFVLLV